MDASLDGWSVVLCLYTASAAAADDDDDGRCSDTAQKWNECDLFCNVHFSVSLALQWMDQ